MWCEQEDIGQSGTRARQVWRGAPGRTWGEAGGGAIIRSPATQGTHARRHFFKCDVGEASRPAPPGGRARGAGCGTAPVRRSGASIARLRPEVVRHLRYSCSRGAPDAPRTLFLAAMLRAGTPPQERVRRAQQRAPTHISAGEVAPSGGWCCLLGFLGPCRPGPVRLTRMRGNLQAKFDQVRRARTEVEVGRAARWTTTRCKTTMFLRVEMWYSSPGAPSSAARVILLHRVSWVSRAPSRQDAVTSRAHIRLGSLQGCSGKCNALLCHLCLFAAAAPCEELAAHVVLLKRVARSCSACGAVETGSAASPDTCGALSRGQQGSGRMHRPAQAEAKVALGVQGRKPAVEARREARQKISLH